jgi:pyrroloquinoline quinone (PQQ) biosynthesis protein C
MPSVSKTQQRLMGQALAYKRGEIKAKDLNPDYADEIKKLAKSMTEEQLKRFARTKHKNLPEKVKESKLTHIKEFNVFFNEGLEDYIIDGERTDGEWKVDKPTKIRKDIEELSPEDKEKIDSMSHRELAHLWRHGSSDNKLFHGKAGEYMKDRLFNHFGGFNSSLSKNIGW